jgi:hypothetical protein
MRRAWIAVASLLAPACSGSLFSRVRATADAMTDVPGCYQLSTLQLPEERRWPIAASALPEECDSVTALLAKHDGAIVVLLPAVDDNGWAPVLTGLRPLPLKALFECRWDPRAPLDQPVGFVTRTVNRLVRCAAAPVMVISDGPGAALADGVAASVSVPSSSSGTRIEVVELGALSGAALAETQGLPPALGVNVDRVHAPLHAAAPHLGQGDLQEWSRGLDAPR